MKSIISIIALAASPLLTATAFGADAVPPALMNFPGNGMRLTGESVSIAPTPEFVAMQKDVSAKLQKLPPEELVKFFKSYNPDSLIAYNSHIWPKREDYEKYKEEWKKTTINPIQKVQLGAYNRENNEWSLHGVSINAFAGRVSPLSISSLIYKADSNVWVSSNGELTPSSVETTSDNVYGARTGTIWTLKKEDSLSIIQESLSITRRTNGEFLYLTYNFSERTTGSGTMLAQGRYVLRFRVGPAAPDPESTATAKAQPTENTKADDSQKEVKKEERPRRKKRKGRRRK